MSKSTNIGRKNRWVSISLIIALTLAMLTIAQASLKAQPKNDNDKNKKLEAQLLYEIEEWLADTPLTFEEETREEIEAGMHAKAKETRALAAQLMVQIERLERIEGFRSDTKKQTRKEEVTVFPTDLLK